MYLTTAPSPDKALATAMAEAALKGLTVHHFNHRPLFVVTRGHVTRRFDTLAELREFIEAQPKDQSND
jgi:hypothetical protein